MKKTLVTTCILGLALTGSSVFAVDEGAATSNPGIETAIQPDLALRKQFQSLDKNKDGVIDTQEAKADKALSTQFKTIAKKGKLDEAGYMNWYQSQQPRS